MGKKVLVTMVTVLIVSIFSSCNNLKRQPINSDIILLNECCSYIEDYSYDMTSDTEKLKTIIEDCGKVLDSDIFNEYYDKSDFLKMAQKDAKAYMVRPDANEAEFEDSFLCKIILIRLKSLLVLKDYETFSSDYLKYYKKFIGNKYTNGQFGRYFIEDKKLTLDNEQHEMFYSIGCKVIDMCKTDIDKYMVLREIWLVGMGESIDKEILNNMQEIENKMGEDFKESFLKWHGFTE